MRGARIRKWLVAVGFLLIVGIAMAQISTDISSITLPDHADTTIVKIDNTKNIIIISYSLSSIDKSSPEYPNPLVSLYYMNEFGYPFCVHDFEATKLSDTVTIDLAQIPKDWMKKGTYFVKIRYVTGEMDGDTDIRVDDKRLTADPCTVNVVVYDPSVKKEYLPTTLDKVIK